MILTIFSITSIAISAVNADQIPIDSPSDFQTSQALLAPLFTESDRDPWETSSITPSIPDVTGATELLIAAGDDQDTDVLVFSGHVGSGQDFDNDEDTGYIYAIFDTDHSVQDSAIVYRSTDGGLTWSFWVASYNSSAEVNNPQIRVVKDSSGQSWVCMFFISGNNLRMRYMNADQSTSGWTSIGSDNIIYYDVDGVAGNNEWVYATYIRISTGNDIRVARCSMDNPVWVDDTVLFANPEMTPFPSIAAGIDGKVSVVFFDNRTGSVQQARIRSSIDYGLTWSATEQVGDNIGGFTMAWSSMAYSRTGQETGWIFLTYSNAFRGDDILSYYTVDGGTSWHDGKIFGGSAYQYMPDVRTCKATGAAALTFNHDPWNVTLLTWTSTAYPNGFFTPFTANVHNSTHLWHPTAGWNGNENPAVLYTSPAVNSSAFFDWYDYTANEEEISASISPGGQISNSPNPFTDMTTISFSVVGTDPVSISIYSVSGRLVKTIADNEAFSSGTHSVQWNGIDSDGVPVVPGIYYARLNTGDLILTNRMAMVR